MHQFQASRLPEAPRRGADLRGLRVAATAVAAGLVVGLAGSTYASSAASGDADGGFVVSAAAEEWEHDEIDGLQMIEVPEVTFSMGASKAMQTRCFSGLWYDTTEHEVSLSAFSMSKTEISVAQYTEFLNLALVEGWAEVRETTEDDAWYWASDGYGEDEVFHFVVGGPKMGALEGRYWMFLDEPRDEDLRPESYNHIFFSEDAGVFTYDGDGDEYADWPTVSVSWYGAKAFADWYGVYLPTEAQWEYAAGGGEDMYPSASGTATTEEMNFNGEDMNRGDVEFPIESMPSEMQPTPVCSYAENARGFCDLGGNVYEWTGDWHDDDYYLSCFAGQEPECTSDGTGAMINPHGPKGIEEPPQDESCAGGPFAEYTCDARVRRGGALNYLAEHTCSYYRAFGIPFRMKDHFGFRIVDSIGVEGVL